MTETQATHGCLPKSLAAFLLMTDKERKSKYGRNVAKYYERVVKSINDSFVDHKLALSHLPPEYRRKITFMPKYVEMLSFHIENEWLKEAPVQVLNHTIENLKVLRKQIYDSPLEQLAGENFDKTLDWLEYLKSTTIFTSSRAESEITEGHDYF